jgi:hypothetical protein
MTVVSCLLVMLFCCMIFMTKAMFTNLKLMQLLFNKLSQIENILDIAKADIREVDSDKIN